MGITKYYVVTNLQQAINSNPELTHSIQPTDSKSNKNQFHIIGVFRYGPPINYEDADVVGGIEIKSIIPTNNNSLVARSIEERVIVKDPAVLFKIGDRPKKQEIQGGYAGGSSVQTIFLTNP